MDSNKAFGLILKQEGIATTLIQGDKGGLTKFGISQAAYPSLDIANLTLEQAQSIYAGDYWAAAHCSDLKLELQYAMFSCAVNCGAVEAIKILQRASQCNPDGIFGPATLASSKNITLYDFGIEWNNFYKEIVESNASQYKFMVGWQNRINTIIDWFKQGLLN